MSDKDQLGPLPPAQPPAVGKAETDQSLSAEEIRATLKRSAEGANELNRSLRTVFGIKAATSTLRLRGDGE